MWLGVWEKAGGEKEWRGEVSRGTKGQKCIITIPIPPIRRLRIETETQLVTIFCFQKPPTLFLTRKALGIQNHRTGSY